MGGQCRYRAGTTHVPSHHLSRWTGLSLKSRQDTHDRILTTGYSVMVRVQVPTSTYAYIHRPPGETLASANDRIEQLIDIRWEDSPSPLESPVLPRPS